MDQKTHEILRYLLGAVTNLQQIAIDNSRPDERFNYVDELTKAAADSLNSAATAPHNK